MLWVLCVDGLSFDIWEEFGYQLPHQSEMGIPQECYRNGVPFTPDVWGSMFLGSVYKHPKSKETELNPLRLRARRFLRNHGIAWSRRGAKVVPKGMGDAVPSYLVFQQMPHKTVLEDYNSFSWGIPAVCDGFTFKSYQGNVQDHEAFKSMVFSTYCRSFDLVAIYTHLIDEVAHRVIRRGDRNWRRLKYLYSEVHTLYQAITRRGEEVLLVSDHGCLGGHTHKAFIGSDQEFQVDNILDVRSEIERRMERILGVKG